MHTTTCKSVYGWSEFLQPPSLLHNASHISSVTDLLQTHLDSQTTAAITQEPRVTNLP